MGQEMTGALVLKALREMALAMVEAKALAEFAVVSAVIAVFAVEPLAFVDILEANYSAAVEFLAFAAALFVLFAPLFLPVLVQFLKTPLLRLLRQAHRLAELPRASRLEAAPYCQYLVLLVRLTPALGLVQNLLKA